MARNSSGTYTLPAGNPVVSATTISTTWANTTLGDISTEISSSLDRSGRGGMTAPLRTPDGTVAAPGHAFTSEPASGLYKAASGDVRLAVGGVDALQLGAGGVSGTLAIVSAGQGNVSATATNAGLQLSGNRAAADGNPDVYIQGVATRTAGYIADFRHGGGDKLLVDYQGLLRLASQAGPIQPAALWTAIMPNASWTASNGLAYWKDSLGIVHLKGSVQFATGASNPAFTLPTGFRPAAGTRRSWAMFSPSQTAAGAFHIDADGTASGDNAVNGFTYFLDAVTFLAEQ